MNGQNHAAPQGSRRLNRYGWRYVIAAFAGLPISLAILLPAAGRWEYLGAWLYTLVIGGTTLFSLTLLTILKPELVNQRGRAFREDTAPFDRWFYLIWRVLTITMFLIAGLEARYHPGAVPMSLALIGFSVSLVAGLLSVWPLLVNPHFETSVRIQRDRGHTVIDKGPYAIVRHPGYAIFLPLLLCTPLVLESWWAFLPTLGVIFAFVWRTAREDKFLLRELDGYAQYASRVRYRLFPGIW